MLDGVGVEVGVGVGSHSSHVLVVLCGVWECINVIDTRRFHERCGRSESVNYIYNGIEAKHVGNLSEVEGTYSIRFFGKRKWEVYIQINESSERWRVKDRGRKLRPR